ncbi:MAG TPA: error-prone DNA polymerase [Anaerolineae bacterium]
MTETAYAELHCHSYFSLLDGSSSPEALVARAQELGLSALALTDHDSLAGAVRFWTAATQAGLHAVIGAEVTIGDAASHLTLLAETQQGYANLCRLLTRAHLRDMPLSEEDAWPGKEQPYVTWDALNDCRSGLIALTGCRRGAVAAALLQDQPDEARTCAGRLVDLYGRNRVYIELQQHYLPDSDCLLYQLIELADALALPCVATNNVHYDTQEGSRLRDALIATRHNQSLTEARRAGLLPMNSNAYLASPSETARRFARLPAAVRNSVEVAERCRASLDFGAHRLPEFRIETGQSEFEYLYQKCHERLPHRYPHLMPAVLSQLAHELSMIEQAHLAGYFLIVWDIMCFARDQGIRCQGRGSAANSIVAYLLGITSIDPLQHHLLFERFLSPDRHTTPDIDIDFATDRREEVIQYVYEKYGQSHTAMVCNLVTYHARSAVRDLGKALGFPQPVIDRLSRSLETNSPGKAADQLEEQIAGDGAAVQSTEKEDMEHPLRQLADLMRRIDGLPRHLSIHVGGMLITGPPLDEIVPLERATMPGRVVCEWNKDSVEDAGLIKIDLLSLRTLGMLTEALTYIDHPPDPDRLPLDDPAVYDMMCKADTIGTFQIESRAQMQMLPRLAPRVFEDVVIEVAIVRPGPIQGDAVHPYMRRRAGEELVTYAHPCLEPVLKETLGVLLFQEQAIRVAVVAAGFQPGEADRLRRALSRYGGGELTPALREAGTRFLAGAMKNGMDQASAEAAFKQLAGFAGYGLCKSHAASFALISYQTCWLKLYHPAAFYCALLNNQPMGFYAPEVIVGDMRRHGIGLLPPDINLSDWRYCIEPAALRTGLCALNGLGAQGWERIEAARENGLFTDLADVCRRTRLPRSMVSDLVRAGVLDAFGERRTLLWQLGELVYLEEELPFVAALNEVDLPELGETEQMAWEYELLGLSPAGQTMQLYRAALNRVGALTAAQAKAQHNGRHVRVGGMQVIRQRPPTAKGMMFISLEDETGVLDVVLQPQLAERYKRMLRNEPLILVEGVIQTGSGAISLLVVRLTALAVAD